jgi:hypothetical protein
MLMIINECEAMVDNFHGKTDPWRIPAPVPLYTPQKPHGLFLDLTLTYTAGKT